MLVEPISLFASAGSGERFTEDNDFAYYVLRIGGNVKLDERLTWNFLTFRYRDGFEKSDEVIEHGTEPVRPGLEQVQRPIRDARVPCRDVVTNSDVGLSQLDESPAGRQQSQ